MRAGPTMRSAAHEPARYVVMYREGGQWYVAGEFRSHAAAWLAAKLARLFYAKAGIYCDAGGRP